MRGRAWRLAALLPCAAVVLASVFGCTAAGPDDDQSTSVDERVEETSTPDGSSTGDSEGGVDTGNADVVEVRATRDQDGLWTFEVTVKHPDTGWDDYADGWDVVAPDGAVFKSSPADAFTRTLAHPHVVEQPFTRAQSGIAIPDGVTRVIVRAHDIVDGFGGKTVTVDLTTEEGPGFTVERP